MVLGVANVQGAVLISTSAVKIHGDPLAGGGRRFRGRRSWPAGLAVSVVLGDGLGAGQRLQEVTECVELQAFLRDVPQNKRKPSNVNHMSSQTPGQTATQDIEWSTQCSALRQGGRPCNER